MTLGSYAHQPPRRRAISIVRAAWRQHVPPVCRRLLVVCAAVLIGGAWLLGALFGWSADGPRNAGTKVYDFHLKMPKELRDAPGRFFHADPRLVRQLRRDRDPRLRRRVISMALYGDRDAYVTGAIENALIVKREWPGWRLRIYYDRTVPEWAVRVLRELQARAMALMMRWKFTRF